MDKIGNTSISVRTIIAAIISIISLILFILTVVFDYGLNFNEGLIVIRVISLILLIFGLVDSDLIKALFKQIGSVKRNVIVIFSSLVFYITFDYFGESVITSGNFVPIIIISNVLLILVFLFIFGLNDLSSQFDFAVQNMIYSKTIPKEYYYEREKYFKRNIFSAINKKLLQRDFERDNSSFNRNHIMKIRLVIIVISLFFFFFIFFLIFLLFSMALEIVQMILFFTYLRKFFKEGLADMKGFAKTVAKASNKADDFLFIQFGKILDLDIKDWIDFYMPMLWFLFSVFTMGLGFIALKASFVKDIGELTIMQAVMISVSIILIGFVLYLFMNLYIKRRMKFIIYPLPEGDVDSIFNFLADKADKKSGDWILINKSHKNSYLSLVTKRDYIDKDDIYSLLEDYASNLEYFGKKKAHSLIVLIDQIRESDISFPYVYNQYRGSSMLFYQSKGDMMYFRRIFNGSHRVKSPKYIIFIKPTEKIILRRRDTLFVTPLVK